LIKKAMVMAAGVGSRLDPLTQNVPKPLVPVLNKPVMDILLEKLQSYGIESVIANTHYLADAIQGRYTKHPSLNIKFNSIYEQSLSGTAGGVKKCEFFFKDEENFLVLSADGLHDADITKIVDSHIKSNCIATMAIAEVDHKEVSKYGVVVPSKSNTVLEFQEKPSIDEAKSNFINTGIYVFNKKIFEFIPPNTTYDFAKNVFPALLANKQDINLYRVANYWSDIGTIDQYIQSNWDALAKIVDTKNNEIFKSLHSTYTVGENCDISQDVKFLNNVVIGNNCKIGKNVCLDNVILWDEVEIKDNTTIKNSVIANNAIVNADVINQIIPASYLFEKVLVK